MALWIQTKARFTIDSFTYKIIDFSYQMDVKWNAKNWLEIIIYGYKFFQAIDGFKNFFPFPIWVAYSCLNVLCNLRIQGHAKQTTDS